MKFVVPSKKYLNSYYSACLEMWDNIHSNYIIHNPANFNEWKNTIFTDFINNKKGVNLPDGYVPSVTYWIVSADEYIGTINIRLKLNEQLKKYGGHIGIAIKPSKQNNIYGIKSALWALKKARELNVSPVLVTCYKSNSKSMKILTSKFSNYYKSEEDILEANGSTHKIMRFWYK